MPRLAGPWVHQCLPARCDLDAYLIISLAFYPCDVYAQPALQTNARCIVLTRKVGALTPRLHVMCVYNCDMATVVVGVVTGAR